MKKSTFTNLIDLSISGTTTGSFVVNTEIKLAKSNPFGKVTQTQTLNGLIGFDYQNSVNNLATKEGKAERDIKPRAWGVVTENRVWVKHTPKGATEEKTYLRLKVEKQLQGENAPVIVAENGRILTNEDIAPYKAPARKSSTQSDLDGEVVERTINLDNVKEARVFGQVITLE